MTGRVSRCMCEFFARIECWWKLSNRQVFPESWFGLPEKIQGYGKNLPVEWERIGRRVMNALKVRFRYLFIQITWHLHHAHFCMLDFYRSHTELLHTSSNTSIFLKHKNRYIPDILTRKSSKNFRNVIKYIEKFINSSLTCPTYILNRQHHPLLTIWTRQPNCHSRPKKDSMAILLFFILLKLLKLL